MYNREELKQTIYDLYQTIDRVPITNDILAQGRLCLVMCFFYGGRHLKDEELTKKGLALLEEIFTSLNSGKQNCFTTKPFLSGVIGLTAVINNLCKHGLLDFEMTSFRELDADILEWSEIQIDGDNLDYFYGSMGAVAYFSQRLPDPTIESYLKILLEKLKLKKEALKRNNYLLINQAYNKIENLEDGQVHFGIAHGIGSLVLVLLDLIEKGFLIELEPTIDAIMELNQKYSNSDEHAFIGSINHLSKEVLYQGRIGWCFSEINTFHMLVKASKIFRTEKYKSFASERLEKMAQKTSVEETKADGPFLCHGFAGLSYYYLFLHRMMADDRLAGAHQIWLKKTLDFVNSRTREYWISPEFTLRHHTHSLLYGAPGIILALLSAYDENANGWSELILLN